MPNASLKTALLALVAQLSLAFNSFLDLPLSLCYWGSIPLAALLAVYYHLPLAHTDHIVKVASNECSPAFGLSDPRRLSVSPAEEERVRVLQVP